jgi:hypothetical protein
MKLEVDLSLMGIMWLVLTAIVANIAGAAIGISVSNKVYSSELRLEELKTADGWGKLGILVGLTTVSVSGILLAMYLLKKAVLTFTR